jgi:hypothetical protein
LPYGIAFEVHFFGSFNLVYKEAFGLSLVQVSGRQNSLFSILILDGVISLPLNFLINTALSVKPDNGIAVDFRFEFLFGDAGHDLVFGVYDFQLDIVSGFAPLLLLRGAAELVGVDCFLPEGPSLFVDLFFEGVADVVGRMFLEAGVFADDVAFAYEFDFGLVFVL